MKVVLLCLALLAVIGIVLSRRNKPAKKQLNPSRKALSRARANAPPPSPYRATSISYGSGACKAVKALGEHRFLVQDTPHLPLRDCDSGDCRCKYIHHDDRRHEESERRVFVGMNTDMYSNAGNAERRNEAWKFGRRASDTEY